MKRWLPLVCLVGCGPLTPTSPPSHSHYTPPPSREIHGELRRGDDVCEFLCDKHRLTWATDGTISMTFYADADNGGAVVRLLAPDGTEIPNRETGGAMFTPRYQVRAGVEYEVQVAATRRRYEDTYKLSIQPPPATEQLAEERPVPPPPTPEEEEPDATMDARLAEITAGFTVVGKAKRVDLTSKKRKLEWKAKAGGCYAAYLVLEAGARLEDSDDLGLRISVKDKYASHGTMGFFYKDSRRILAVGGEGDLCAATSGSVEVELPDTGTGHVNVMLYERHTDVAALNAQLLEDERDMCTSCMSQRLECQETGHTGPFNSCKALFKDCIQDLRVQCKP